MTIESLTTLWVAIASTFTPTARKTTASLIKRAATTPTLLTHILPQLGKCVHESLTTGRIIIPHGLFFIKKGWQTPAFLHEYFSLLYDRDGYLKEDLVDGQRLKELLTLLFLFYKLEVQPSPQQVVEATQKFIDVDNSVKTEFSLEQIEAIKDTFRSLLPSDPFDIRPHNSNGATADRISNVEKDHIVRHIPKLQRVYNLRYFFNTKEHATQARANILASTKQYGSEPTARLAFVPKDSRGPRSICMEPHEIMKIQKGLQQKIYDFIESPECQAYKKINFTDQTINQRLAYLGSLDGSLATIDLKDASDLVSWNLIEALCDDDWKAALNATRSDVVTLPDGRRITIKKFASMGSALCFPIEAMLFYSIAKTVTDSVWVYGDDIIVRQADSAAVIQALEAYGLQVNTSKTLTRGFFRESCGGDFYRGANITPLRFKKIDLVSIVALANNFADAFSLKTGEAIIRWYESINQTIVLRLHPENKGFCPLIAFYTPFDNSPLFKPRYNVDLQRYEIKALTVVTQTLKFRHNNKSAASTRKCDTQLEYMLKPTYGEVTEYNEFFAWLTRKETSSQPLADEALDELLSDVIPYQNYSGGFGGLPTSRTRLSKPKVCFRWAGVSPVSK